jgi:hypothetical protein
MPNKTYHDLVNEARTRVAEVSANETMQLQRDDPRTVVVDCREPNEAALGVVAGAVVGIALTALQGRSMQSRLPFGTFLALAAYVASVAGDSLLTWYLGSFQ